MESGSLVENNNLQALNGIVTNMLVDLLIAHLRASSMPGSDQRNLLIEERNGLQNSDF
jgi:hypothetical protein